MQENLSAPAQNAPPDVKRYSAEEFEKVTGIPRGTLRSWACRGQFAPAENNGRGKPSYYFESQIADALALAKRGKHGTNKPAKVVSLFDSSTNETVEANDYREDDGSNDDVDDVAVEIIAVVPPADNDDDDELQDPPDDTLSKNAEAARVGILAAVDRENNFGVETLAPKFANVTIETPPFIDDMQVVSLAGKTLQELADEGRLCFERGDDCLKQGAMYYVEGGRRLIEAKRRLKHGEWQKWLKENFAFSQDTAENRMNLAKRFGESKSETFRNLKPATLIKLLALPEGDEEKFIEAQAEAGKPIEEMTTREVQKAVKTWRNPKTEGEGQEVKGEYFQFPQFSNAATIAPVSIETAPQKSAEPPTVNQDKAVDALHETILPFDCSTIHEFIGTATLDDLKELRKTLSKLAQEVESKIGELLKSTSGDSDASNAL